MIVGARVTLYTSEQAVIGTVHTNQEGRFFFLEVPMGNHVLHVSSRGFLERRIPVALTDGGVDRLSVVLDIQPPWEQVSVTAIPGYVTFNLRGGIRLGERHDILVNFENIGDRNYRGVSWGVDAPGRGVSVSYRTTF